MRAIDIIDYASKRLLKRSIDIEDGIDWLNDCLSIEIGKNAHVYGEAVLSDCKSGQRYDLPPDYIAIKSVYNKKGETYTDWNADETQIVFKDKGSYTVKYYKMPDIINQEDAETATPDCHSMLHSAIPYYLAYRFLNVDFPANKETEIRYLEFQSKLNEALSQMQKRRRTIKVHPWM
jgi:hypothetical protein